MTNKPNRPERDIPLSSFEVSLQILAALGLLALFLMLWHYWPLLPERIPQHFGFSGQPDAWGSKEGLLPLAWVALGLYVMLSVLEHFPRTYNYPVPITEENAARQYQLARILMTELKAAITWLFFYLDWGTIQVALGRASGLGFTPLLFVALLLLSTIIYLAAAYRQR